MHLSHQSRLLSNNLIQFSQMLDLKVQERNATLAIQAEEKSDHAHLTIKAKETRPFGKALTAIEANPWLETCMWLVTISIEGYSALRFVLEEYQLMNRAKMSFLQYTQEIGRMPQFIVSKLRSLRYVFHQKASFCLLYTSDAADE